MYMGPCGSTKQFLYPFQFSIRTDAILLPGNVSDSCLVPISCTTVWGNEETNIVQEDRKEQSGVSDSTVLTQGYSSTQGLEPLTKTE